MGADALTSNHVNYLVWRYLQEAGYGDAARQLSREWNRSPESLPFAKDVKSHTLINIIQDGLWVDKLQANIHQAKWQALQHDANQLAVHAHTEHHQDGQSNVNGVGSTGAGSTALKRKRRSSAADNQSNGDLMQIETNSETQPLRIDGEPPPSQAVSPTVDELPPPSTFSIGESTGVQSEKVAELTTDTAIIRTEDSKASILQTMWSPATPTSLLATGRFLASYYPVPSVVRADTVLSQSKPINNTFVTDNLTITAACWGSLETVFIATLEDQAHQGDEEPASVQVLSSTCPGSELSVIATLPEIVFALRWSSSSELLLGISSNDIQGSIWVWQTHKGGTSYLHSTTEAVTDAAWVTDVVFAVCGHGFLKVFECVNELRLLKSFESDARWEKLRYDGLSDTIACISLQDNLLGIISSSDSDVRTISPPDKNLTALEFQPVVNRFALDPLAPRMLATACDNGTIQLWDAKRPFQSLNRLTMDSPAMAIAFSPDGLFLSAAGLDTVLLWNAESGGLPKAFWRGTKNQWLVDGMAEDDDGDHEHSLSWDADGKKLAFTLGNQIAVISFRR